MDPNRDRGGFVRCDGRYFTRNGTRIFPVGINYLPSYLCGDHFSNWHHDHIMADLDHLQSLGLDCVRVAVFWKGFEPRQGIYSEDFLAAFKRFVAECSMRGLLVMPVFLVGTWTGIYDAPYWKAPGMYQGEMLELEAAHIVSFVRHFSEEPAILCWDLSDEPWYLEQIAPAAQRRADGPPASRRDIATAWVARLSSAIRGVDGNHLVTLGSDPEPVRKDTGFAREEIGRHLDVMAYCIYPAPSHGVELDLISYGAFQTRFFAMDDSPAFLHEGPGVSSSAAGEGLVADRFRAWMYSSLANGNIGVLPWCYTDYQRARHTSWPLDDKPQEPNFGVFYENRTPKPRAAELLRFARDVRRLPLDELELERSRAVIVYPYDYYEQAAQLHARLWRHFTMAGGATMRPALAREDRLPDDASLIIVPGFPLRLSTWERLSGFVAAGGHLVLITDEFFCLNPALPELFGVKVECLRHGSVEVSFGGSWGRIPAGSNLSFGTEMQRLWVEPGPAEVVATYSDGWPFLLEHRIGTGCAYLATFPFTLHLDLRDPHGANVVMAMAVLREIRDRAGCTPLLDPDRCWIETAAFFSTRAGDDWAVVVNWDHAPGSAELRIANPYRRIDEAAGTRAMVRSDPNGGSLALDLASNDAVLLRLQR